MSNIIDIQAELFARYFNERCARGEDVIESYAYQMHDNDNKKPIQQFSDHLNACIEMMTEILDD